MNARKLQIWFQTHLPDEELDDGDARLTRYEAIRKERIMGLKEQRKLALLEPDTSAIVSPDIDQALVDLSASAFVELDQLVRTHVPANLSTGKLRRFHELLGFDLGQFSNRSAALNLRKLTESFEAYHEQVLEYLHRVQLRSSNTAQVASWRNAMVLGSMMSEDDMPSVEKVYELHDSWSIAHSIALAAGDVRALLPADDAIAEHHVPQDLAIVVHTDMNDPVISAYSRVDTVLTNPGSDGLKVQELAKRANCSTSLWNKCMRVWKYVNDAHNGDINACKELYPSLHEVINAATQFNNARIASDIEAFKNTMSQDEWIAFSTKGNGQKILDRHLISKVRAANSRINSGESAHDHADTPEEDLL